MAFSHLCLRPRLGTGKDTRRRSPGSKLKVPFLYLLGYRGNPGSTAFRIVACWYRTQDLPNALPTNYGRSVPTSGVRHSFFNWSTTGDPDCRGGFKANFVFNLTLEFMGRRVLAQKKSVFQLFVTIVEQGYEKSLIER